MPSAYLCKLLGTVPMQLLECSQLPMTASEWQKEGQEKRMVVYQRQGSSMQVCSH